MMRDDLHLQDMARRAGIWVTTQGTGSVPLHMLKNLAYEIRARRDREWREACGHLETAYHRMSEGRVGDAQNEFDSFLGCKPDQTNEHPD